VIISCWLIAISWMSVINCCYSSLKACALAVVAANRLASPSQSATNPDSVLSISRLGCDPYGFPIVRGLIDTGAFKIYHHWVKKNDNQSRAALFETSPRRDIKIAVSLEESSSPVSPR